jgi:hypothetical protein
LDLVAVGLDLEQQAQWVLVELVEIQLLVQIWPRMVELVDFKALDQVVVEQHLSVLDQ